MATTTARRGRQALDELQQRQNIVVQEPIEEEEDDNGDDEIWMVTWIDRHEKLRFFQTDDLRLATETLKRLQRGTRNKDIKLQSVE